MYIKHTIRTTQATDVGFFTENIAESSLLDFSLFLSLTFSLSFSLFIRPPSPLFSLVFSSVQVYSPLSRSNEDFPRRARALLRAKSVFPFLQQNESCSSRPACPNERVQRTSCLQFPSERIAVRARDRLGLIHCRLSELTSRVLAPLFYKNKK